MTRASLVLLLSFFISPVMGADFSSRVGSDADSPEGIAILNHIGVGMHRINPGRFWDGRKGEPVIPREFEETVLASIKRGMSPLILFDYYTRFPLQQGPEAELLGEKAGEIWYAIGKAYARKFAPGSQWLEEHGVTEGGIVWYTAFNEPLWAGNNWRPFNAREYYEAMKGLADGVHSVDPQLKVAPGGYIEGMLIFGVTGSKCYDKLEEPVALPANAGKLTLTLDIGLIDELREGSKELGVVPTVHFDNVEHRHGWVDDAPRLTAGGNKIMMEARDKRRLRSITFEFDVPKGAKRFSMLQFDFIRHDLPRAKDVIRGVIDNLVLKTEGGEVVYRNDFEDGTSNFMKHSYVPPLKVSEHQIPAGDAGTCVGMWTAPFHPLSCVAPLFNDGTLAAIDIHRYWGAELLIRGLGPSPSGHEMPAQMLFDKAKRDYGITGNPAHGCTEFNVKDSEDEDFLASTFFTAFWQVMGVSGDNGEPVTAYGMPFTLLGIIAPGRWHLDMSYSHDPWKGDKRAQALQMLLRLTEGADLRHVDRQTGVLTLRGKGKTIYVWHSSPDCSTFKLPADAPENQQVEIYRYDSIDAPWKSVRDRSIGGLAGNETFMFVLRNEHDFPVRRK